MLLQIRKCINMPCQNYKVVTGIYVTILHHHIVIFSEIKKYIYMLTFIFVLAYMLLRNKQINGLTQKKQEMIQKHICPPWCIIQVYRLCRSKTCPKQVNNKIKRS